MKTTTCFLSGREAPVPYDDAEVLLQTKEVVTVGPLEVKFKEQAASSHYRTNQAAAGASSTFWMASFLLEKVVAIPSVAFFSEKSDEPILSAKTALSIPL